MRKVFKIFIGFLIGFVFVTLLVSAFLSNKEKPVSAQEFSATRLVCDEPIPIGEAAELVSEILNTVYKEFRDSQDYLDFAVSHTKEMAAELYVYPETICDFSKCYPRVTNLGPSVTFEIDYFYDTKKISGLCVPLCKALECAGDPCPDLKDHLETTKAAIGQINSSKEIINKIFKDRPDNETMVPVTEDIRKEGEPVGKKITKFEAAKRKLKLAREWLHSAAEEGKRTCVLTDLERKKVEAGELGDRYQMRCTDALEDGVYWPRAWSENCQDDCTEKVPTDKCKTCLAECEGTSALAEINCKIYGTCKSYCQEELTQECIDCLCCKKLSVPTAIIPYGGVVVGEITCQESLSEQECTAWICGGSTFNWVCCHESPLEFYGTSGGFCEMHDILAQSYTVPYPAQRAPQLQELLDCIASTTGEKIPLAKDEPGASSFYGTVFTYDHDFGICNFTRGETICSACSHSRHSCHYGGTEEMGGNEGALAVDFGNENNYKQIKNAAMSCGVPEFLPVDSLVFQHLILYEKDHIHISVPACFGK